MSVLRPLLSRRGRLVFVATALLLVGALVAAPGVSGAKNAVKQFTATITPTTAPGGVSGTWTEQVTNCGFPVVSPCTASSTIGLGTIRVAVPTEFQPVGVTISAPSGRNWVVSYDSATGNINAGAATGSDKLQPGESVSIIITATPAACAPGTKTFTTAAWGSASVPGTDPFTIPPPGSQPTVTLAGSASCLESGDSITDPVTGQKETIDGDFQGHVNVTFGGTGPDCGGPEFGTLGDQWQVYHLPTQVTITPAPDFVAGAEDKISTSEFALSTAPGGPDADSSWYLICFAVPQAGHTAFETRGGGTAIAQTIGGIPHFVGILASCADAPTPCVSEQFLTTGPGAPPWTPGDNKVHIAIRMKPGDPYKR
jgi:hypothetical protein